MAKAERKSFRTPDEVRNVPKGRMDLLTIAGGTVGRIVLEPGWRWSKDIQPLAGTRSCEAPHFQYHVSGRLGVRMDDGTELIAEPGDVTALPYGHDAWVVGDEPAVVVDWAGASAWATRPGVSAPAKKAAPAKPARAQARASKAVPRKGAAAKKAAQGRRRRLRRSEVRGGRADTP